MTTIHNALPSIALAISLLAAIGDVSAQTPKLNVHHVGEYAAIPWVKPGTPIAPGSRQDRVREMNFSVASVNLGDHMSDDFYKGWNEQIKLAAATGNVLLPRLHFWDGDDRFKGPMRDVEVYWRRMDKFLARMDLHLLPGWGGWIPSDGWIVDTYFKPKKEFRRFVRKYLITAAPLVIMPFRLRPRCGQNRDRQTQPLGLGPCRAGGQAAGRLCGLALGRRGPGRNLGNRPQPPGETALPRRLLHHPLRRRGRHARLSRFCRRRQNARRPNRTRPVDRRQAVDPANNNLRQKRGNDRLLVGRRAAVRLARRVLGPRTLPRQAGHAAVTIIKRNCGCGPGFYTIFRVTDRAAAARVPLQPRLRPARPAAQASRFASPRARNGRVWWFCHR